MAINPNSKYPTQTQVPSGGYPLGSAQDVSSPGAGDGTPYKADVLNDIWGLLQRLLNDAGITPSGVPDSVTASDYYDALVALFLVTSARIPFANRSAHRGARVRHSTSQSISDSTPTALAFNTEVFDTDTIHDTVTNNTRLTVPSGVSKIKLHGQSVTSGISTGQFDLYIYKNGTSFADQPISRLRHPGGSTNPSQNISSGVLEVSPGDYFELVAAQYTGAGVSYAAACWFEMEIIE